MNLRALEGQDLARAAAWLAEKDNYQWLDFGHGQPMLTAPMLGVMRKRDQHLLRVFTSDDGDLPIGVIALSDISQMHRIANLWYVLGEKRFAGQGYTSRAVAELLTVAFGELGLYAVQAWTAACNASSIAVLQRNQFRQVGLLRQAHEIDGRRWDRLLFDLLASERVPNTEALKGARGVRTAHGKRT